MDISLIIEGIETRQQRERLLSLGCTEGQGFLFSRPLARPDFDRLLVERTALH
jgi:EAL domain-containing protein (putative c-di-GMP-specific phosphodiesterase class I)